MDTRFPSQWPFGILKTAQWVLSFLVLIALWSSAYTWPGTGLVSFTAWIAFFLGLISWFAHLFGLQKKTLQIGGTIFYMPFAIIDFVCSVVLVGLYTLSSLLCVYFMFKGFNYSGNMAVCYAFATMFCVLAGAAFAYFALLLFRVAEKKPTKLCSIVVEGSTTAPFDPAVGSTTTTGGPKPPA